MAQTPPFRSRPKISLPIYRFTGSPRPSGYATPVSSGASTPNGTPFATTAYSPFRSAGLKPPNPYHTSRNASPDRERSSYFDSYSWFRTKRRLSSKPLWFFLALLGLLIWWSRGRWKTMDLVQLQTDHIGRDYIGEGPTKGLQFFPATNPKIHVGRHLLKRCGLYTLTVNSTLVAGQPLQTACEKTARFQVRQTE